MKEMTPPIESLSAEEKRALLADLLKNRPGDSAATYPLSHNQRSLWFLHQLAPENSAYNLAFSTRIRSRLDVPALHRACQVLLDRHAVLRTTFTAIAGEPVQLVRPSAKVDFRQVDASTWSEADLERQVVAEYKRPFDLEKGPLLRVVLHSIAEENHVFLLAVHHIVFDGWSAGIVSQELLRQYSVETGAAPPAALSPHWSYSQFVQWQRDLLSGPGGDSLLDFWRARLAGDPPALDLPTDRPRPPVLTFNGVTRRFTIDGDRSRGLRDLAREEGSTLFMVMLAVFQVLLHRYSGQRDILIGSPVSCRGRAELQGTVGDLVNMIPLRVRFEGEPSFRRFLGEVRKVALDALSHRDYPYALLVERLAPKRDSSRLPLFDAAFSYQMPGRFSRLTNLLVTGMSRTPVRFDDLVLESYPLNQQEGQFDLNLEVREAEDCIHCALITKPELFEEATVNRMQGHYETLLDAVLKDPELPITRLPLMTPEERRRILVDWNDTDRDYELETTLVKLFEDQVARSPRNPALVFEDQHLTYAELNARANQIAHYLKTRGVGPEVPVGLFMERSVEMVVGIYGILKAGGAYVPLDPDYPAERIGFMIADTRVPVVLTQAHLRAALPPIEAETICLDGDWEIVAGQPDVNPSGGAGPGSLAYVIFTSGSTGRPKGVQNEHRGIVNRLLWMQEQYGLTSDDRVLQKTPFSFDVSVWEFFWPLLTGACLVVARPGGHRDSGYLVDAIIAHEITTLHFVPSMLRVFLEEDRLGQCSSIRRVICSGEALSVELQNRFFSRLDTELHNLYGPTEAAVDVTYWPCRSQSELPVVPIGFPVANTQIYILDQRMQPVPVGCPGELHIGGVQVARGYLNRPELTAEKFIPDPFRGEPGARLYKTGDLARYRNDGSIEYLGRIDFQVKVRGLRVELGEIENLMASLEGVGKCVVVLREDRPGDQRLVAYYEGRGQRRISIEDLRRSLKAQLPGYMVPQLFVQMQNIPLSTNGKVDRRALPPPLLNRGAAEGSVAPRNDSERRIAEIWAELIGCPQVGIFESFFDLGGHSLLLPKMLRKLEQAFPVDLSIVDLFQFPTIASLSEFISEQKAAAPDFGKARSMAGRQLAALQRQKRLAAARSRSDA